MDSNLEQLKAERGGKCHNCRRFLRPEDEDHTFCNECWSVLMHHPFTPDDGEEGKFLIDDTCMECDEGQDHPIHKNLVIVGKCANCSGYIFEGEGDSTVHYGTCWNEFKQYLEESVRPLHNE